MDKHFDFLFGDQNIDVMVDDNGIAWFQGPQVAPILGYTLPSHMYRMLNSREADIHNVDVRSANGVVQTRKVVMINEFGIYRLIMSSRRSEAAKFQNWLYYQVLPSIRRYGAYIDSATRQVLETNPNAIRDLNQRIAQLEDHNALLEFFNAVNRHRLDRAGNGCNFYRARALFYQRLLGIIDDYCLGDADTLKDVVCSVLDDANHLQSLEHDNGKTLLYHVTDPNKR